MLYANVTVMQKNAKILQGLAAYWNETFVLIVSTWRSAPSVISLCMLCLLCAYNQFGLEDCLLSAHVTHRCQLIAGYNLMCHHHHHHHYYCSNASTVLGVVILSTCQSVLPSLHHVCALWQNERTYCRYFDTAWKDSVYSFLTPTDVGGRRPLPPKICAHSDPSPFENADFDRFPLVSCQL